MNVKALLTDDDAVSPVIGVILMVAITVILAAVIGTFVLGLQDRVGPAAPSASFSWEMNDQGDGWGTNPDFVNITHDGGDQLEVETINVTVGDDIAFVDSSTWAEDITAGDTVAITDASSPPSGTTGLVGTGDGDITEGDDVRVIWESSEGDSTQTIGENEVG